MSRHLRSESDHTSVPTKQIKTNRRWKKNKRHKDDTQITRTVRWDPNDKRRLGPKIKQIKLSLRSAGSQPRAEETSRVRSSQSQGSKKAARIFKGVSAQQVLKGRDGDIGVLKLLKNQT